MKGIAKATLAILVILSLAIFALPHATAVYPSSFDNAYPRTVWGDMGETGMVSGKVTWGLSGGNVTGAYVAIVNASNESQEYYSTRSDQYGNFIIAGINATYSSGNRTGWDGTAATYLKSMGMYQVYANVTYGNGNHSEGYSGAFGIDANANGVTAISIALYTKPTTIVLRANNTRVDADGQDTVMLTAYGYDALGNPVTDGTPVALVVTNQTNLSEPQSWIESNWSADNGSLGSRGRQYYTALTSDNAGSISTSFGWVPEYMGDNNSTVYAYFSNDPTVNASVRIFFMPATASWTGYVVDSSGTGYGGIPVTLHIMGVNSTGPYEIYNMTGTTSSSQPFVGLFTFDYILMRNAAYGYVDASAHLTDNLTIYGKSNNYSMNMSATSMGAIVLKIPPPDAIRLTAEKDAILVGGQSDWIVAQLYYDGLPYRRANVTVAFSSDNDTIATLPGVRTNITDLNGQAWILLTSNHTIGKVNINGTAQIMYQHNLTDMTTVRVVGWGTVSGIVTDQNKVGIPNANVTLWNVQWNNSTNSWENVKLLGIPENPQLTNDGRTAAVGMYTFYRVPWDVYNVTGEKEGHMWYALFCLGPWPGDIDKYAGASNIPGSEYGTATHNIAIPDCFGILPAYVTASPTVTPPAAPAATIVAATPMAKPTPGFEALLALVGLLGIGLSARKD